MLKQVLMIISEHYLPSTGQSSTLPIVIGFLAVALILFVVMIVLRRKSK